MKIRLIFLSLLCLCFSQVQGQDKECAAKAARIDSLVATKKFDEAFDIWKSASKCNIESIYRNGEILLADKLSTPLSQAVKAEYTARLMQLYTDYDRFFPGNNNNNAVKKALYIYRTDKDSPEIYELLDRAFTKDRDNFTDANALHIYFVKYYDRFNAAEKSVTEDDVLAKLDDVSARLEQLYADTKNADYRIVAQSIRTIAAPVASCEKLEQYYEKRFATKHNDAAWLQAAAVSLSSECQRSPFYYKAASAWHELEPDAKSSFHLAQASLQQRKKAEAVKYFTEAAESEPDALQKAEIYYTMAMLNITDASAAIKSLEQSLKAKPDFGKAYLMLAEVYASTDCGNTAFEKKARYTLAAETALKAAQIEPALKKTAESKAALFRKKAPSQAEIKEAKMGGKTINFACGINKSVTLP